MIDYYSREAGELREVLRTAEEALDAGYTREDWARRARAWESLQAQLGKHPEFKEPVIRFMEPCRTDYRRGTAANAMIVSLKNE